MNRWTSGLKGAAVAVLLVSLWCEGLAGQELAGMQTDRRMDAVALAEKSIPASLTERGTGDWIRLGDAQLRAGQSVKATKSFEHALRLTPELEPQLWQYGIALFFANRPDDGKALFEKHRVVNPHDVENAAWHFLCVARAANLAEARKLILPAPDDRRPPMKQILQRLPGGGPEEIEAAVAALKGTRGYDSAQFYADLYLGLIAEAEGDLPSAKQYMDRAAQTSFSHYMADVARTYAVYLKAQPGK